MVSYKLKFTQIPRLIIILSFLCLFVACQSQSDSPEFSLFAFNLPANLSSRADIDPSAITAKAEILGETALAIDLQIVDGIATGAIDEVPVGLQTLKVTFIFNETDPPMELVTVEKLINVTTLTPAVVIRERDFFYPDDDDDNYSNLRELESETNPLDDSDFPNTARMFVTSAKGQGDLSLWPGSEGASGLNAGDSICNQLANAAELSGDYRVWLSTSETDAFCHLIGLDGLVSDNCGVENLPEAPGPWVRIDGKPFSNNLIDLVSTNIVFNTGEDDENNGVDENNLTVWTGSSHDGTGGDKGQDKTFSKCGDWSSSSAEFTGLVGLISKTISDWTYAYAENCDDEGHLYCFEIDQSEALPDTKSKGKGVFVTSMSGTGDFSSWLTESDLQGVEAADEVCKVSAREADLNSPENYKAWISDSQVSAMARLKSEGPWVRTDGTLLTTDRMALIKSNIETSLSVNEFGEHLWAHVWTGTDAVEATDSEMDACQGWTSASTEDVGIFGMSVAANEEWSRVAYYKDSNCGESLHLYCFEDE